MTGIQFVTDDKGHRVAVQIDFKHLAIRIDRSDDEGWSWRFLSDVHSPKPGEIWGGGKI